MIPVAKPLDLDLLRTLVAVAETGSFSMAAHRVGRSQSAVSMQIHRLETTLAKQLLVRSPKSVVPTPAGNDFLAYARRLLQLSDEALASVAKPEESGTVRLGIPEDYALMLPDILQRFGRDHPGVTVDLTCEPTSSLVRAIEKNRVDIAIVTRFDGYPAHILRREPMVWVASARHAIWQAQPLPVALFQTCTARINILNALTGVERPFRCTYSSASLAGMIALVQSGLAVAGLARCSVPPSLKIIAEAEGLPPIAGLEIGILRSAAAAGVAVDRLHDALSRDLGTAWPH